MRHNGCKIRGKWTSSYTAIHGNEQADTLAKNNNKNPPCAWTRTTLSWLRNRPHYQCLDKWQVQDKLLTRSVKHPFGPTAIIPRRSAQAFARLRTQQTMIDGTPIKPSLTYTCGGGIISSKHFLLDCENEPKKDARKQLLTEYDRPATWEALTLMHITVKPLLRIMATTGMLQVRQIIRSDEDARNVGYELGEDI